MGLGEVYNYLLECTTTHNREIKKYPILQKDLSNL